MQEIYKCLIWFGDRLINDMQKLLLLLHLYGEKQRVSLQGFYLWRRSEI